MVGLGSIESLRHEVASQLTILSELPLPRPINPRNCVMTGSGDSFIASVDSDLYIKLQNYHLLSNLYNSQPRYFGLSALVHNFSFG